jgi:hypothetical protein
MRELHTTIRATTTRQRCLRAVAVVGVALLAACGPAPTAPSLATDTSTPLIENATAGQRAAFWVTALPYADQAHAQTGLFTSVILAQWADETAYGTAGDWTVKHNPGNISHNGVVDVFSSLQTGVDAYVLLVSHDPRYASIHLGATPTAQASLLGLSPWAESQYRDSTSAGRGVPGSVLRDIIDSNNLTQFDAVSTALLASARAGR